MMAINTFLGFAPSGACHHPDDDDDAMGAPEPVGHVAHIRAEGHTVISNAAGAALHGGETVRIDAARAGCRLGRAPVEIVISCPQPRNLRRPSPRNMFRRRCVRRPAVRPPARAMIQYRGDANATGAACRPANGFSRNCTK
jgi:hypothetical protein